MEYPLTQSGQSDRLQIVGLNPCSNGIPSDMSTASPSLIANVLIPVLMEYPLTQRWLTVLWILSLNPCSNGIPSDLLFFRWD